MVLSMKLAILLLLLPSFFLPGCAMVFCNLFDPNFSFRDSCTCIGVLC